MLKSNPRDDDFVSSTPTASSFICPTTTSPSVQAALRHSMQKPQVRATRRSSHGTSDVRILGNFAALTPSTRVLLTIGWSSGCGPKSESGCHATTSMELSNV